SSLPTEVYCRRITFSDDAAGQAYPPALGAPQHSRRAAERRRRFRDDQPVVRPRKLEHDDALRPRRSRTETPGALAGISRRAVATPWRTRAAGRPRACEMAAPDVVQICEVHGRGPGLALSEPRPLLHILEPSTFGKKC